MVFLACQIKQKLLGEGHSRKKKWRETDCTAPASYLHLEWASQEHPYISEILSSSIDYLEKSGINIFYQQQSVISIMWANQNQQKEWITTWILSLYSANRDQKEISQCLAQMGLWGCNHLCRLNSPFFTLFLPLFSLYFLSLSPPSHPSKTTVLNNMLWLWSPHSLYVMYTCFYSKGKKGH